MPRLRVDFSGYSGTGKIYGFTMWLWIEVYAEEKGREKRKKRKEGRKKEREKERKKI